LVVLNENPTMKIRYTFSGQIVDNRCAYIHNSQTEHDDKNGALQDRLTAKGYGESQLVNDCDVNQRTNRTVQVSNIANRKKEFIACILCKIRANTKCKRLSIIWVALYL
jgi:hypothetical protein